VMFYLPCRHMPSHASREVLTVFGSLTTCDPGDILETVKVGVTLYNLIYVGRCGREVSASDLYTEDGEFELCQDLTFFSLSKKIYTHCLVLVGSKKWTRE